MAKRLQYNRLLFLVLLLGAAFVGLGYRLVDLQVVRHDELAAKAQQNTQKEILLEPRRGDIFDAKGNQLATSVFVKTVAADPTLLGDCQAKVARTIAPILGLNEGELYQRLLPRTRTNATGKVVSVQYVVLKRKVAVETWEKVNAAMSNLTFTTNEVKLAGQKYTAFVRDLKAKAVFTDPINDQQRYYPNTNLAAHVLGYVGMDERDYNGSKILETSGKDGIEFALNSKLSGVRGWRITETDSQRRELVALRDQDVEARDGQNVVLTIDSVIQNILETALAEGAREHSPISISGIVVRPRTGEILAMATLPTFDPNNPGSAAADARRNRVITDMVEPGSTFKIVVVSGALNDSVVTLRDQFDCENGAFAYAGRVLHDHERYGVLSVEGIITKSSNIGAAKVGIRLGADRLYEYICDFGFGQKTGIPLPGEVRGLSYAPKDWSKVSIAQIPMGHGICVTRLQMTMAMAAMANKGALMRPMMVDRLEDRDGRTVVKYAPQKVRQVISEKADALMVTALKTVVGPEGTAKGAMLDNYSVAGKTGTAQKVENGQYVRKYIASFIGFFPGDNPELCISIFFDEPKNGYYGGQAAAPVFKQVAERAANYLNIRPDLKDFEPSAQETIAAAPESPIRTVSARSPNNNQ
jgi:cell division protein FtsI/penicillin-binding protein 2